MSVARFLQIPILIICYLQDEKYLVTAYDSIVTVVEPEVSIYDLKLCVTMLH